MKSNRLRAAASREAALRIQEVTEQAQGKRMLADAPVEGARAYRMGQITILVASPGPRNGWLLTVFHPERTPTWAEFLHIRGTLVPTDVRMSVDVPVAGEQQNSHTLVAAELPDPNLIMNINAAQKASTNSILAEHYAAANITPGSMADTSAAEVTPGAWGNLRYRRGYADGMWRALMLLASAFRLRFEQAEDSPVLQVAEMDARSASEIGGTDEPQTP